MKGDSFTGFEYPGDPSGTVKPDAFELPSTFVFQDEFEPFTLAVCHTFGYDRTDDCDRAIVWIEMPEGRNGRTIQVATWIVVQ
jgi:hypothetical protein